MKKLGSFIKSNTKLFIGFILGALIFGSIGAVVAGTVASSEITYTNNGQTTVEGAINDLYGKAAKIPVDYYKYWNDNYSDGSYSEESESYSEGSVPSTVYASYTSLVSGSADKPFIRTTYVNGSPKKHNACLYLGNINKVFCIEQGFWEVVTGTNTSSTENGERVTTSLKVAMEKALGTSTTSCYTNANFARCYVGSAYCSAHSGGYVDCDDGVSLECSVESEGEAKCYVW